MGKELNLSKTVEIEVVKPVSESVNKITLDLVSINFSNNEIGIIANVNGKIINTVVSSDYTQESQSIINAVATLETMVKSHFDSK